MRSDRKRQRCAKRGFAEERLLAGNSAGEGAFGRQQADRSSRKRRTAALPRRVALPRGVALLCLSVLLLGGCGRGTEEGESGEAVQPIVNFRAITLGNMPEEGMDEIYRQLDALTIPELNCTLRFEFIPWGNERRQLNIVTASRGRVFRLQDTSL